MKAIKLSLGIFLLSVLILSCKNEAEPELKTVETADVSNGNNLDEDAVLAKAEFNIEGMTCAMGCAKSIEKNLAKMDGVKSAMVDFDKKLAMVEYDEAKVTPALLEKTVTKTGEKYSVHNMRTIESATSDFGKKKGCSEEERAKCISNGEKTVSAAKKGNCAEDCKRACCKAKA